MNVHIVFGLIDAGEIIKYKGGCMEKSVLKKLKEQCVEMEVQLLIQDALLNVYKDASGTIPSIATASVAQQKDFLEQTCATNRLVIAELKKKINKEEENA